MCVFVASIALSIGASQVESVALVFSSSGSSVSLCGKGDKVCLTDLFQGDAVG